MPFPAHRYYLAFALVAAVTIWRLVAAFFLPVTQDEAYYFDWARSLAWGYFDHPPGVAFLGVGTVLGDASGFASRLGTALAATLTLLALASLYRGCGLRDPKELALAILLAFATLPGLAGGVIATPDTLLALGWSVALHEALPALRGQRKRWLTAGLATGVGLLGKYSMVLIGPVFLWALLWVDARALRTPWPYLGGLLALLIFLPNLLWNAENDWLTMRFQFGHGFSMETGKLTDDTLPQPIDGYQGDPASREGMSAQGRLSSVLGFVGQQVGLWGLIAIPAAVALLRRRGGPRLRRGWSETMDRPARALLTAAALFPLLFFGVVASFSEVEANWPAPYLMAAVPLVAVALRGLRPWALAAAAANLLLASLYVIQGATAALPLPDTQKRVLRESHGYDALAEEVSRLPGPIFAESYQITAMLRFHRPDINANQWPGITRPSEYLRGRIVAPFGLEDIRNAGGFWLVSLRFVPPEIPGFRARKQRELVDCGEPRLLEREGSEWPCPRPLHVWNIYRYAPDTPEQGPSG